VTARVRAAYWDPDGSRYGLHTYWWRGAPPGLATRRQLRAAGLRPAGQPVAACSWQLVLVPPLQLPLAPPRRLATGFGPTPGLGVLLFDAALAWSRWGQNQLLRWSPKKFAGSAAQILWRGVGGIRAAYLYRVELAAPKRPCTPAQRAALGKAMAARRTCPTCRAVRPYVIPRSLGECVPCAYPEETS
jgi:hypothetical protein